MTLEVSVAFVQVTSQSPSEAKTEASIVVLTFRFKYTGEAELGPLYVMLESGPMVIGSWASRLEPPEER